MRRRYFWYYGSFDAPEKKFSITFTKAKIDLCLSIHFNGGNSYLFVNRKEIINFKANNDGASFPIQFCLGSISNEFDAHGSREVSLGGNLYNFSDD